MRYYPSPEKMTNVRVRFAPSPTGFLHVGGVRTAFWGWLLARHNNGKFLLRIEDTDQERRVPGAIRYIIEELGWYGIQFDEGPSREELRTVGEDWDGAPDIGGEVGPYIQSLRLKRYQEIAEQLIEKGFAYRCDCTSGMLERERLEQMARKEVPGYSGYCRTRNVSKDTRHVVRFKMPLKRALSYTDAVKGRISWEAIPIKDTVILKSDGFPIYNFAVVIDDHDMKISHVLRGDEFISTTPIHLLLYEALGWTPPVFAHLPVILGQDGKKLSKRDGAVSSSVFREKGYLPEALLNFIVLIGWSLGDGDEQEIFAIDELVKRFTLERINPASGVFDYNKLAWMNGLYIRNLPDDKFISLVDPFLKAAGLSGQDEKFRMIAPFVKERVKILSEAPDMVEFLFRDTITRDVTNMFKKGMTKEIALKVLSSSIERLGALTDWSAKPLEEVLRPIAEEVGLKVGVMLGVIRIAVTGKEITPPLFESLQALGQEEALKRLKETVPLVEAV